MQSLAEHLLKTLFPLNRSITGSGVRDTFSILSKEIPLDVVDVPSGSSCYDWKIPDEWNIKEAWIKNSKNEKVVDFAKNNLHVMGYSEPIHKKLKLEELEPHLHTLPDRPEWVPYRTSYYRKEWGFCLPHKLKETLCPNDEYEVFIDSEFNKTGVLNYAQSYKAGNSGKTYLISTYCCHPSLANDNLSGIVLSSLLFKKILNYPTRHSYILLIAPETIGVVAYLFNNQLAAKKIDGGFVVTTVAGPGKLGLKKSYQGDSELDRAAMNALKGKEYIEYPFAPAGSDERQYASPGFRIPTLTISKDKYYEYPQYHTSADNLEFVQADYLMETLEVYWDSILNLERNFTYVRTNPFCEYQLGKYDLYPQTGGVQNPSILNAAKSTVAKLFTEQDQIAAMNWLMFACDGKSSLLSISETSGLSMNILSYVADLFEKKNLIQKVDK